MKPIWMEIDCISLKSEIKPAEKSLKRAQRRKIHEGKIGLLKLRCTIDGEWLTREKRNQNDKLTDARAITILFPSYFSFYLYQSSKWNCCCSANNQTEAKKMHIFRLRMTKLNETERQKTLTSYDKLCAKLFKQENEMTIQSTNNWWCTQKKRRKTKHEKKRPVTIIYVISVSWYLLCSLVERLSCVKLLRFFSVVAFIVLRKAIFCWFVAFSSVLCRFYPRRFCFSSFAGFGYFSLFVFSTISFFFFGYFVGFLHHRSGFETTATE